MSRADDLDDEPVPERFGRHRVIRLLGRGAMGSVYEAEHEDLHKRVAIKTMRGPDVDHPERRERFLREGRAASRVHHPHAIDVYDVGVEGGSAYLVMEFLDGEDLEAMLAASGPLSVKSTLEIMLPVLAAVSAAHDAGVVHRDLKPANIFLAKSPEGPHPKVVDFGISKLQGDGLALTASAAIMGTPYYLAPEQLEGAKFTDARSDQWALSVILYECLTGQRPFEGDSLMTLLWQIGQGELRPMRALRPELSAGIEAVVLRGLMRKPVDRHASVRALGASLLPYASDETRARWSRTFAGAPSNLLASTPVRDLALDETLPPEASPRVTPLGLSAPSILSESVREVPPAEMDSEIPPPPMSRGRKGTSALAIGALLGVLTVGGAVWKVRSASSTPRAAAAAPAVTAIPQHASRPTLTPPLAATAAPEAAPPAPPEAAPPPAPVAAAVTATDAGAAIAVELAAGRISARRSRRHRSRHERAESNAPHAATTMVNGAPVLPAFPQ